MNRAVLVVAVGLAMACGGSTQNEPADAGGTGAPLLYSCATPEAQSPDAGVPPLPSCFVLNAPDGHPVARGTAALGTGANRLSGVFTLNVIDAAALPNAPASGCVYGFNAPNGDDLFEFTLPTPKQGSPFLFLEAVVSAGRQTAVTYEWRTAFVLNGC